MKILFTACLLFLSIASFSQFAIISDRDGYVNIRTGPTLSNQVQDTLHNNRFVYCYDREGSFYNADYSKRGEDKNGYVYHDRVKMVTSYERIARVTNAGNLASFSGNQVKVTITTQRFDKSKYKITYNRDAPGVVEKLNGKTVWGTDGNLPSVEYKSIEVQVGQKTISLPASATENLFEPNNGNTKVNYDRIRDILYIQSANSDGAGYYEVIWRIEKGVYKDRWITVGL